MAIERIYFPDENFVLTLIYGSLDNQQLSRHVMEMNAEYQDIDGVRELADCRHLRDVSALTGNGLIGSAHMEQGSSRVRHGKGIIVVAEEHIYGLARMYAAIASQIRDESRVTYSLDEALGWLGIASIRTEVEQRLSDEAYRARGLDL